MRVWLAGRYRDAEVRDGRMKRMPVGAVGEAETGFDGGRRACPEVRRTCSVLEADLSRFSNVT